MVMVVEPCAKNESRSQTRRASHATKKIVNKEKEVTQRQRNIAAGTYYNFIFTTSAPLLQLLLGMDVCFLDESGVGPVWSRGRKGKQVSHICTYTKATIPLTQTSQLATFHSLSLLFPPFSYFIDFSPFFLLHFLSFSPHALLQLQFPFCARALCRSRITTTGEQQEWSKIIRHCGQSSPYRRLNLLNLLHEMKGPVELCYGLVGDRSNAKCMDNCGVMLYWWCWCCYSEAEGNNGNGR